MRKVNQFRRRSQAVPRVAQQPEALAGQSDCVAAQLAWGALQLFQLVGCEIIAGAGEPAGSDDWITPGSGLDKSWAAATEVATNATIKASIDFIKRLRVNLHPADSLSASRSARLSRTR